jgi:hypothetical protein
VTSLSDAHPRADAVSGDSLAPPRRRVWRFRLGVAALMALALAAAYGWFRLYQWVNYRHAPLVAAPDIVEALTDRSTVQITITTPSWETLPMVVPLERLGWDPSIWRQMHFGNWDRLPREVREPALGRMAHVYAPLLRDPAVWREMTAGDWVEVPQPVRAVAFLRMVHHWTVSRQVGVQFGLDPVQIGQTIGAIIMAESWFDHLAINVNPYGNRDVGLAQCSDHCRRTLAQMAADGEIPFAPTEMEYFDPSIATWVATVWFERELRRAEGDVELAIRAYHRGLDNAMDERGTAYLANVLRLRERYVRTQRTSASWRFLVERIAFQARLGRLRDVPRDEAGPRG